MNTPYHFPNIMGTVAAIEAMEAERERRLETAVHVPRPDGTFDTVPAQEYASCQG